MSSRDGRMTNRFGGHARAFVRASAWTLVAQLGSKACIAAALAMTARMLNVGTFGVLVEVQAAAFLIPSFWDLGVSSWVMRDVSAAVCESGSALQSAFRARLVTIAIPVALWGLLPLVLPESRAEIGVVAMFFLSTFGISASQLFNAFLQAELRFGMAAIISLAGRVATLAFLAALILGGQRSSLLIASAYTAGEAIILAFCILAVWHRLSLPAEAIPLREVLRRSRPYAVNSIANLAYNKADVLTVGLFGGTLAAAQYAPASRIQDAVITVPAVVGVVLVPLAARRLQLPDAGQALKRAASRGSAGTLLATAPMVVAVFLLAQPLVPRILGSAYQGAVGPVRVIVWSGIFVAIAVPYFSLLIATGAVRRLNRVYLVTLIVAFVGQAMLSYRYGAIGGASASAGRDAVGACLGIRAARSITRPEFDGSVAAESRGQ